MVYLRKTIKCGPVCYIEEYPAPAYGKNRRRRPTQNPTTENQGKLNDKYAAKKLAHKILCNFRPYKDLFVTLTPEKEVTEQEALKKRSSFLEKLRRYWKSRGKELKYIAITEKQGRWHHHFIMLGTPLEVIRRFWEGDLGRVTVSPLNPYDDYKGLSEYLVCGGKLGKKPREKGRQRYSCSRNLEGPEVTEKELKRISKAPPRPPKGYLLKEWSMWADGYGELHKEYRCVWAGPGDPPKTKRKKVLKTS